MTTTRIIFDLDGTILDTMADLERLALDTIARNYSFRQDIVYDGYRRTIGSSFAEQLEELFPNNRMKNAVAASEFAQAARHVYAGARLRTQAVFVLREAPQAAIASSTQAALFAPRLQQLGVGNILAWGREHGTKLDQLRTLVAGYDRTAFIGDAPRDAQLAAAAGVGVFVGVLGTFASSTFRAQHLSYASDLYTAYSLAMNLLPGEALT